MKSKLLNFVLTAGIGLGGLMGLMKYELSAINWEADKLIIGEFKKGFGDDKLYGLILKTIKGDYTVYVINCEKYPISKLLKEIKSGDYLEIGCGLNSNEEKELDCFTDSCLIKKILPDIYKK